MKRVRSSPALPPWLSMTLPGNFWACLGLHVYGVGAGSALAQVGSCIRGDKCPYAHNVFEYWLHPTR